MALMPSLQSLCALQFCRLSRFCRVLFQQRCALGMFYGTSQAQDRELGCIRPRLVRRGFLMRLGVVCLADFAVKNTTFKRRLLAMLYGDIIYKYKCAQLFKAISKLWESHCHLCVIGYGYNKYNMFDSALHKAKAYKQEGNTLFTSKDYEKALQHYTLSINAFPLIQVYSNRAMTYINLEKYQQALEDCECALKMDKTHLKTILRKAKCLIYLLKIDQATNFLEISVKEENKQGSKELTQLANKIKESIDNYQVYRKKNEYTQAREFLNECYSMMKNNTVIIVSIIQCQARINKAESMKLLNSINATIDQTCFIYWYLRAIIQLSFGFKDRAKTYLKQTLRYFTTKPLKQIEKKLLISFTKKQLLQLLENISTCQKLIKESYSLLRQEKYKQVIKKLNIVLDADTISSEQRVNLLFMRSRCFKLTKQKPKQLNDLNKLLRIQLNHVQALQARMQLYQNEKKYELALRDAKNLHTITNKHNNTVQKFTNFVNSIQQEKLDYYETLGIDRTATQDDIKKAYKQLAIIYHPDKNRGLNEQQQKFAKEKFKEIKKAQVCLIDPQKRQLYDHHNCDPQEFDQQNLRKNDFFDIFSSFGAFGGTFESFFNSSQAGTFRPGSSNARNNFQGFFPNGFSFSFTPNGFPF